MVQRIVRYVQPKKFEELTGYTVGAIAGKIQTGAWRAGREYCVAPDGRRLVDIDGYEKWVEQGRRT